MHFRSLCNWSVEITKLRSHCFPVNFEHGDVDPVAFGELKAGLSYEFPDRRESSRDGVDPNLSVYVKTDQLTYSNMTRSARGKKYSNPLMLPFTFKKGSFRVSKLFKRLWVHIPDNPKILSFYWLKFSKCNA